MVKRVRDSIYDSLVQMRVSSRHFHLYRFSKIPGQLRRKPGSACKELREIYGTELDKAFLEREELSFDPSHLLLQIELLFNARAADFGDLRGKRRQLLCFEGKLMSKARERINLRELDADALRKRPERFLRGARRRLSFPNLHHCPASRLRPCGLVAVVRTCRVTVAAADR